MITPEMVARINLLARKQKEEGLSSSEKEEQAILRRQYIDSVKANAKIQLDCVAPQKDEKKPAPSCGCGCECKH